MRAPTRRRTALTAGSLAAAATLVATALVPASAGAATGVKVSPTSGPVGTTVTVSGTCGADAGGGSWLPTRIGLYFDDAFTDQYDQRSTLAESTTSTNTVSGAFSGTVTVPSSAKYEKAGPTPATPGGEVSRAVSGKLGVQVVCMSTLSAMPWSVAKKDAAFTVVGKAKQFDVTKKPSIKGKKKVGKKLRAKVGTWSPEPTSFSFQWKRGKKDIAGATKKRYKVTSKDAGKKLRVVVTGERSGYETRSVRSAKVKIKGGSAKTKKSTKKASKKTTKRTQSPRERLQERRERLEQKRRR